MWPPLLNTRPLSCRSAMPTEPIPFTLFFTATNDFSYPHYRAHGVSGGRDKLTDERSTRTSAAVGGSRIAFERVSSSVLVVMETFEIEMTTA
jgi:hypothetical protein